MPDGRDAERLRTLGTGILVATAVVCGCCAALASLLLLNAVVPPEGLSPALSDVFIGILLVAFVATAAAAAMLVSARRARLDSVRVALVATVPLLAVGTFVAVVNLLPLEVKGDAWFGLPVLIYGGVLCAFALPVFVAAAAIAGRGLRRGAPSAV